MSKTVIAKPPMSTQPIPEEHAVQIRHLAHELSNALEVIVQTSYLLSISNLPEPASDWLKTLESGVNKALATNLELREFIKKNAVKQ